MKASLSSTGRIFRPFVAAFVICATLTGTVSAQSTLTPFSDISAGAWYEQSARALIDLGALDASPARFRPNDQATRAEMVELLVRLRDQTLLSPLQATFNDVPMTASYYRFMETAAQAGWVRGDGNCYGMHPCTARPLSGVNRAEAATLLLRVFALPASGKAPDFSDNANESVWFYAPVQAAADHCILQGDDFTRLVRPASGMNRAEMIVMFHRAHRNMTYGVDCGMTPPVQGDISSVAAVSRSRVRLTFTTELNAARAANDFRYSINAVGSGSIRVTSSALVAPNMVDLTLASDLKNQTSYRVNATDLLTEAGVPFSASRTFLFEDSQNVTMNVSALSATRVRVQYAVDMNAGSAGSATRYTVRTVSNNIPLGITGVAVIDSRTVELTLSSGLQSNVAYLLTANDVLTQSGVRFYGNSTFTFGETAAGISGITPVSATMLRLSFPTDLQQTASESVTHYRVTGNGRDLSVTSARLVSGHLVDLTLGEAMENQRMYTVTVNDLRTAGGVSFTGSASTLYLGTDVRLHVTLIGAKEVPPVSVALSGTGTFTLTTTGLSYDLTLANMSGSVLTGAHLHRGSAGVNGPVVHPIVFTGSRATGTWTDLTEQDRNDIIGGNIYVNVHTQAFPDGAIRSQLTLQ
ncbi:MAG: CHRD domain-containing protein [Candidatus Peribacteraceae bacterium]|nr:CHRD domain-containing protein [Candidatus Peribacteraceae bacterium]